MRPDSAATTATRGAGTSAAGRRLICARRAASAARRDTHPGDASPEHLHHTTPATCRLFASVAPPGFCNKGEVRYGSIGGLEYEVPQSRLYCLCINVALCSTALQGICRVIRRSSMTMKAHTYYIIFGRPLIGGKLPPFPPGGATGLRIHSVK